MIIPSAKEENKSLPPPPKASSPLKFAADLAAGGTAGGLSKTVVAPIERVKLLLQTQVHCSHQEIEQAALAAPAQHSQPSMLRIYGRLTYRSQKKHLAWHAQGQMHAVTASVQDLLSPSGLARGPESL